VDTFKLSNDPQFIDKVRDVVGLYLDPPEQALVLAVDEKSQIQALDRPAPVLPMMPGMPQRRTHDYVRHGITTLLAALDVATGTVIGSIHRRHRAVEFKKFLAKLDKEVPADLDVHLICDNYTTHKHPTIQRWLTAHPRFHMHFTPTYSSWLNQVERWFGPLTDKQLRRGAHRSIQAREKTSAPGSNSGTPTRNRSPGPKPRTKSSNASPHIFNESLAQDTSSALLCCVIEWPFAGVAGAGHDGEQALQLAQYGIDGQAGVSAFGSRRNMVQKAWASTARVTWRCQPTKERPSKWSMPRPVLRSR
jgi:hypothetical protein